MADIISVGLEPAIIKDLPETLNEARSASYDFVVTSLAHPRHQRQVISSQSGVGDPFTRSDLLLSSNLWSTVVVGRTSPWLSLDSEDVNLRLNSERTLRQEIAWAAHLQLPAILFQTPAAPFINYCRNINQLVNSTNYSTFWIEFPLAAHGDTVENSEDVSNDPWYAWNTLRTFCDYHPRVMPVLELTADLPDADVLKRWTAEPVKAIIVPLDVFLTNAKGFPVLSKRHQEFLIEMSKLKVQFILRGCHSQAESYRAYYDYLIFLWNKKPQMNEQEKFESPYYDYLQSPLQPLADNLESSTYEVFEKDPIKYVRYEDAIFEALKKRAGAPTVVMVAGAGRGPLVTASLNAAQRAEHSAIKVYAIEKNPNAVVTLQNQREALGWGDRVTIIDQDMRYWEAPEQADILVSELLGSFGDNELSPECLDGAQKFLKADGISIPYEYTSYVAPIAAHKIWSDVHAYEDLKHLETTYVAKYFNAILLDEPKACFKFVHPNRSNLIDNSRYITLRFTSKLGDTLHGFAGFFEAKLYEEIMISILPATFSHGMFSWFPLFIPLRQPVSFGDNTEIEFNIWRCAGKGKVWYEWSLTKPIITPVHNPAGRSVSIGL